MQVQIKSQMPMINFTLYVKGSVTLFKIYYLLIELCRT